MASPCPLQESGVVRPCRSTWNPNTNQICKSLPCVTRSVGSMLICGSAFHIWWLSSNAFKHPPSKKRIVSPPVICRHLDCHPVVYCHPPNIFLFEGFLTKHSMNTGSQWLPFPTERVTGCNWRQVSDFLEMEGPPEAHGALWQRGMLRAWEPGALGGSSQTSKPASQPTTHPPNQPTIKTTTMTNTITLLRAIPTLHTDELPSVNTVL